MKKILQYIFPIALVLSAILSAKAQCPITAYADKTNIVCGDPVNLSATNQGTNIYTNDFNAGLGGWSGTTAATTGQPCNPSQNGTNYLWMGASAGAPRSVTTNNFNLSTGGTICFDMKFATQGAASPCEGPDLPSEGVDFQYSTDGGATWISIQYYDPNGGSDPNLINWKRYCLAIPAGAMTASTKIRWNQSAASGAAYDNWGLDNVVITVNNPAYQYIWQHTMVASASSATPIVYPSTNTTYTVVYTDGGVNTCSASVAVTVALPTATATATPASYCAGGSSQLLGTSNLIGSSPTSCSVNATAACTPFSTVADEKAVGSGSLVYGYNDGSYPTFGNFGSAYATTHILYRASDLAAAGIVAGQINSLTFDVAAMLNSAGSQTYPEMKIDMGCTASTVMVSYANPTVTFSTVFNPRPYTMSVGLNTFFFDQSYNWDGVQNIVIRICWRVATGASSSAMTRYAFTKDNSPGYNCVFSGNSNFEAGQCAISSFTSLQSRRPNTTFGFCKPRTGTLVYQWTPTTGLSSSTIANPIANPTATTTYTVAIYETGKSQCVHSANVTVTVNPTPTASASGVTICSSTTTTLTATGGTTYQWFSVASGGAALASTASYTTPSLTTTTTYYVETTAGGCTSPRIPVVVTVTAKPATPTAANVTICSGNTATLTATAPAGATFNWFTAAAGGATLSTGASFTTPVLAATTTYYVESSIGACIQATRKAVVVTVVAAPVAPTAAGTTICSGNTATLTATAPGGTYNWYAAATGGASLFTGASFTTPVLSTSTTYYVDATNATPCTGPRTAVVVTVNPIPVAPTAAGVTICSGNTATLTATAPGPVYNWFAASTGGASLFTGAAYTTPALTTTTTYYVQTTQSGCISVRTPVVVTVTPLPTATGTPNPQSICSGTASSVALTSNVAGASFSWPTPTATAGITGGSASSGTSISQTLTNPSTSAGTVTYVVTPNANGCNGSPINVVVTVNPTPVALATPSTQSICTNTATSIALTSNIAGTTYAWAAPTVTGGVTGGASGSGASIVQTLVNPGTSAGTVTYSVTPTANGCVGNPINVVITVNPTPIAAANPNPQTICSGTAPSIALTSATAGTTFAWTAPTIVGTITGASAGSGSSISQTLTNTGTSAGTVTYSVTPTANGCVGTPVSVVVTVNPIPVATASPQTICSGQASNVTLNSNVSGTTFAWTASATASITGSSSGSGNTIAQTLTNTGTSAGTVTYTVTPTANGCTGLPINVVVTINPNPNAIATPATKTICSNNDPGIALTSSVSGTTFSWTVTTTGAIGGAVAGTGTSIGQTLTNTGNTPATATYTVTPTANTCVGTPITVTVTVNPIPTAVATPVTICSGQTTSIGITSNVAGATFVWTATPSNVTGSSAGSGSTIAQTLTATTSSAGTVTYLITPTANGCSGTAVPLIVTVNPTPNVTATPSTITICSGTAPAPAIALSGAVSGTTFTWGSPVTTGGITGGNSGSGTTINDVLTNPSNTLAGTVTYSVTPTANGCPGTAANIVITVNPSPVAPVASPVNYCVGNVSSPLTATGSGLKWYDTDNTTVLASAPTPNTSTAGVFTYYVSQVLSGCEGPKTPVVVTINAVPPMPASASPLTYCQGDVIPDLTASGTGGTIKWYSDAALTTLVYTGSPFAANITNTISYWVVEESAAGCKSPSKKVDITVNPTDDPTFTYTSGTYCQTGSDPTPTIAKAGGAFTVMPVTGLVISANGTIDVSASTIGTYTITYTTNGVCPKSSNTTVTITSSPDATFTYSGPYCEGGAPNPLPAYTTGSAGIFSSVPGMGGALDVNTGEIDLSIAPAGTYTVTNTITSGGGCANATDNQVVTINPTPSVTADKTAETICSGATTNINFTGTPAGVTFSWTVTNITGSVTGSANGTGSTIAQTLVNTGVSQATVTYDITPSVSGNSCTSNPITVIVTIDPLPTTPIVTSPVNYCENDAASALSATIAAGATANWFDGSHVSLGNTAPIPSTSVAGTFTYTVSQTINSCTGPEATITVVVNPIPAAPTAPGATYCQGAPLSNLTATGSGGTFKWYSDAALTMQVGVGANFMPTNTVTTTYYVVETKTGCASAATPVVVTIIPKDDATFAYSGATFCLTGTNPTPVTIVKPGGTFSAPSPVVIDPTTGTVDLAATGLGSSMPITYTTNGACPDAKIVNITITNAPSANFSYAGTYCASGTALPTIVPPNSAGAFTSTSGLVINSNTGEVDLVASTAGTYTVTNTIVPSGGCAAASGTASITINPAPTAPAVTNLTYCENATAPALTAIGSNLLWYTTSIGGVGSATAPTPTTTPPGTTAYYVSQTVAGCEGPRASLLVNINPLPAAPTAASPAAYCQGDVIAPLIATGSGGTLKWYSDAGLTSQVGTNSPFNSGATTTSSFYVNETTGGCAGPGTKVDITVNPSDDPTFSYSSGTYCQAGGTNPTPTAVRTGNTYSATPAGLSLNPATGTINLAASSLNTYTITCTTHGLCPKTATTIVSIVSAADPSFTYAAPAYCKSGTNPLPVFTTGTAGTFSATPVGLVFVDPNTGEINLGASATGTYTVKNDITGGGCPAVSANTTVTINTAPPAPVVTNLTYCKGAIASQLTPNGAGYTWYNALTGGAIVTPAPTPLTNTVGNKNYYVSQTAGGCEGPRATLMVTTNPVPVAPTATTPINYCKNDVAIPLTATAVSGGTLSWYTVSTGGAPSATAPTPNTAGSSTNFWVSETATGCEGPRFKISVVISTTPTPTTSNVVYCENDAAVPLTATGTGGTFKWYDASNVYISTIVTPATTPTGVTTYNVSQVMNGCESGKASLTVTVNAPIAPTVTTPVTYCYNSAASPLTANVTTAGNSLVWYDAGMALLGSTPTPSTSTAGSTTYYVSQKTAANCEGPKASITVVVNQTLAPVVSDIAYCQNDVPIALSATGTSVLWYTSTTGLGSSTAPTPSTGVAGITTYYATQTANNCESVKAPVNVTINALPNSPTVAPVPAICPGSTATLTATAPGGNYTWYDNTTTTQVGSGSSYTTLVLNTTTTYYVDVVDANSCKGPQTQVVVIVNTLPNAPVANNKTICQNDTVGLQVQGIAGEIYKWYDAASAGNLVYTGSDYYLGTPSASISYYIEAINASGCISATRTKVDLTVNVIPAAPIVSNPPAVCKGDNYPALTATGGGGTFTWYSDAALTNLLATGATYTALGTVTNNVTFYVRESNGLCYGSSSPVNVTYNDLTVSSVNITANTTSICNGQSVKFTATGNNSGTAPIFTWYINNVQVASSASSTYTGTYFTNGDAVYCVMAVGSGITCPAKPTVTSNTLNIVVNPTPITAVTFTDKGCAPLSVDITAQATGMEYKWSFNPGDTIVLLNNPKLHHEFPYTNGLPTTFSLRVTNPQGCYKDTLLTATVYQQPIADFSFSPDEISNLDPHVDFTDKTQEFINVWKWNFGDNDSSAAQNPSHFYKSDGVYNVKLYVINTSTGCNDTLSRKLIVNAEFVFYIPDAFTPNGDGINDTFGGKGIGVEGFDLRIYNRWGNEIFHSDDMANQWDGSAFGKFDGSTPGVYTYRFVIMDVHKKKHEYVGKVSLLK